MFSHSALRYIVSKPLPTAVMAFKYPFSVHGLLTAILRPFRVMSESWPTVPGLFTPQQTRNGVSAWRTIIFSDHLPSQCRLKKMTYCKCQSGKEHEFLLLEFYHPSTSQTTILVVDRTANNPDPQNNNNGSSSRTSGIISPSASPTPDATDNVFTAPKSAIQTYLTKTFHPYLKLCTLDFSAPGVKGPSATQIAVLLSAVSKSAPQYHVYQYQCYWFAETVWEAVKRLFSGGVEGPWISERSRYRGVKIDNPNRVGVVCEEFNSEWANIQIEAERKEQEEEARTQEDKAQKQRLREYEVENDRLRAKGQDDEAEIARSQAENNRLLARIAELESRS